MPVWTNLPIKWKLTTIFLFLALFSTGTTFFSMDRIYTSGFMLKNQQNGENIVRFVNNLIASSERNLLQGVTLLRHNEELLVNSYLAMIGQSVALDETLHSFLQVLSCHVLELRDLKGEVLGKGATSEIDLFHNLTPEYLKTAFETEDRWLLEWVEFEDAILLRELVPIYYQGVRVGTLGAGIVINDDFVHHISEMFGQEIAIFKEHFSVAASSPAFAKASQPYVIRKADSPSDTYTMFPHVKVNGTHHALMITALLDHHDTPIGTLVVGMDETELNAIQQRSRSSVVMIIAVIAVLLFMLAYWTSSIMARPLIHMTSIAQKIARGEITEELPLKPKGRDEVTIVHNAFRGVVTYFQEITLMAQRIARGDIHCSIRPRSEHDALGKAFQQMVTYLQKMAAIITAIAEGNFRQEITVETAEDQLGKALQQLHSLRSFIREIIESTERLNDASAGLSQVSADMASGAEQVSHQTRTVSASTQQISQRMLEVTTATEEMTANIREISRMTREVSESASTATEMTNTASMTIFALKSDSEDIGDIVEIINAIAQQTNLLALNATIEAARAGDLGRGFAVVAGEVKNLARETTLAVEDIVQKIQAMQTSSKEVTDSVVQLSDFIHRVHELSGAIASAIEQQTATAAVIASRIGETTHRNEEITHTIADVAAATSQVSQRTIHVQEAADELTGLASQLRQLIKKFQV